jgi:chemotaxis-related protein WspD
VSASDLQPSTAATAVEPSRPLPDKAELEIRACWNEIGVQGNASCTELKKVSHCRNCPVFAKAALLLLDRPLLPDYRHDWTQHFAKERKLANPARHSALLFRIDAEWLALPAPAFQEVVESRLVHSLPHRRDSVVLGLVNVRGELLICVSLSHLLGLSRGPVPEGRRTYARLLVAQRKGDRIAFPADEVRGILRYETPELHEPPAVLAKSRRSYTAGVLRWHDQPVGLLDAELLFASLNRSLT